MIDRIPLPLTGVARGINRNALEGGQTQVMPRVVSGFDLDQAGGYRSAWRRSESGLIVLGGGSSFYVEDGVSLLSETVLAYSPDGAALLSDTHLVWRNSEVDMTGGSIAGLGTYLVPRVGVVARPNVVGGDVYTLGAYYQDTLGNIGDLNRVSGFTVGEGSASTEVDANTYRFMVLIQAPTKLGFVTYQVLTDDYVLSSGVDELTITLDTVLPLGYAATAYWWDTGSDEPSFFQIGFQKVSDGTAIVFTLDDTTSAGATQDPTVDAILAFGGRLVEPHNQRVYGVGSSESFVGPFTAGLDADKYFDFEASSEDHALDTPDSASLDAITDELRITIDFADGVSWSTGTGEIADRGEWVEDGLFTDALLTGRVVKDGSDTYWTMKSVVDSDEAIMYEVASDTRTLTASNTVSAPGNFLAGTAEAKDFGLDGSGNFYLLWRGGVLFGGTEWAVQKLNSSLVEQWVYYHESEHDTWDFDAPLALEVSVTGETYFVHAYDNVDRTNLGGSAYRDDYDYHGYVTAVDSAGSLDWTIQYLNEDGYQTVDNGGFVGGPGDPLPNNNRLHARLLLMDSEAALAVLAPSWMGVLDVSDGSEVWGENLSTSNWQVGSSQPDYPLLYQVDESTFYRSYGGRGGLRKHTITSSSAAATIELTSTSGPVVRSVGVDSFDFYYAVLSDGTVTRFSEDDGDIWSETFTSVYDKSGLPGGVFGDAEGITIFYENGTARFTTLEAWYLPFATRGTQFEVGLKSIRIASGKESAYFYATVDGVEILLNTPVDNINGGIEFTGYTTFFTQNTVEFTIDLASGDVDAVNVDVLDSEGNTVATHTNTVSDDWPATFTATNETLNVLGYYPSDDGLSGTVRYVAYRIEYYNDKTGSSLVANADADDYTVGSTTFTATGTGETWTVDGVKVNVSGGLANVSSTLPPESTLIYSDIADVNLGNNTNYVFIDFQNSPSGVTGLVSTPAGLLIFGDNETFLLRGDPGTPSSLELQRTFGVFGNDVGGIPGRLGGVAFPIWKGRVYSISMGMGDVDFGSGIQDISEPVFDPADPFVQVVGEPRARQVVARTRSNRVYRFDPARAAWYTDVWSEASGLLALLPNPDSSGIRYVVQEDPDSNARVLNTCIEGSSDPYVQWEDVDVGDKNERVMWRRVYIYTNSEYANVPILEFDTWDESGTVTGINEGEGQFSFTFPRGVVASKMDRARVTLVGAVEHDSLEAPVEIEFARRYRRR